MEIFKSTNFDFLGKKWPFIIASLILTVAGLSSIALKGGLRYGIDFRSGAVMRVQFAYAPPLDKIRSAMAQKVRGEVSVQNFSGTGAQNQVEIGTELQGQDETQLNVNRQAMQDVLKSAFGQPNSGKLDLNNSGATELARRLRISHPELRVLLASGYAQEIVDSDRHEDPLLAKPFSPETLLAAVDAVLGPAARVDELQLRYPQSDAGKRP